MNVNFYDNHVHAQTDRARKVYWQLDQSQVPIVTLINNTDSLYPKVHCCCSAMTD